MLTEQEYLDYELEAFEATIKNISKNIKDAYEMALKEDLSREEREKWISTIVYYNYERERFPTKFDREKARLVYRECEVIWRSLQQQFKCEWVDDDSLAVDINCKDLSFFCRMVAALYNLHAGMFSFSSSFTTHEAYTQSNHLIHISALLDGRGLIRFHLTPKEAK